MRIRLRAALTLNSAKLERRLLLEKLAERAVRSAGKLDEGNAWLNSQAHWADVGRYWLLDEILCAEDK